MISIATGANKTPAATLDQPLDHLSACHRRIEQRLDTLERAATALPDRREEALQAIRSAFAFLDSSGVHHTEDEEVSLFPRLEGRLNSDGEALVFTLEAEHEVAHGLYAELQRVVENLSTAPAHDESLALRYIELTTRFCALYRQHIQREDSELARISRAVLSEAELAEISSEMKARRGL